MLRFMADEYDDTCSTVFPLLQTVLANVCHAWYSTDIVTDLGYSTRGREKCLQIHWTILQGLFFPRYWTSFCKR